MIKVYGTTQGGGGEGECDEIVTIEVNIFLLSSNSHHHHHHQHYRHSIQIFLFHSICRRNSDHMIGTVIIVTMYQTEENGAWNGLVAITASSHVVVSESIFKQL